MITTWLYLGWFLAVNAYGRNPVRLSSKRVKVEKPQDETVRRTYNSSLMPTYKYGWKNELGMRMKMKMGK